MVDEFVAEPALDAQPAPVDRALPVAAHAHHAVAPHAQVEVATDAAVGTRRLHFPRGLGRCFGDQCPDGASHHTLAARNTPRLGDRGVAERADHRAETAERVIQGVHPYDLVTGAHADAAEHTLIRVEVEERVRRIHRQRLLRAPEPGQPVGVHAHVMGHPLQPAAVALGAGHAIGMVVGDQQLGGHAADLVDFGALGPHDHPLFRRGHAREGQRAAFDLDHAQPADTDRHEVRVVAQVRDVNPRGQGRFQHGHAWGSRDRQAVDAERDPILHRFLPQPVIVPIAPVAVFRPRFAGRTAGTAWPPVWPPLP